MEQVNNYYHQQPAAVAQQYPGQWNEPSEMDNHHHQYQYYASQPTTYIPVIPEDYHQSDYYHQTQITNLIDPYYEQKDHQIDLSAFPSPPPSYPSSAEQSPSQQESLFEPEDEMLELDPILNEIDLDLLFNAVAEDEISQLLDNNQDFSIQPTPTTNVPPSSLVNSQSPKRKFSIDSSECGSADSFDESYCYSSTSSPSSTSLSSPQPDIAGNITKPKRTRRCKHTREERAARKKDQNKKAAIRYRNKKKCETVTAEQILEQLESRRQELNGQQKKIETEFNVLIPLARASFYHDPIRGQQLQQLLERLSIQFGIQC